MNFKSDLEKIIRMQFKENDVCYEDSSDLRSLVASYFELLNRTVDPVPRTVHFSDELHISLGKLLGESETKQREKAKEAWGTVFRLCKLLEEGQNVNGFLSKRIDTATGERSRDGLLWDYGMHHFHLRRDFDPSGFVKRSDYLLFAIVTQKDAYLVDVRSHQDPENLVWVRQNLLQIVHSNWPQLIEASVLPGVEGSLLTDEEKKELRRKNTNHCMEFGGNAIMPLGGGTMANGSSIICSVWAGKLLHEIKNHQGYFESQPSELRSVLESSGVEIDGEMQFELVLLDGLNLSDQLIAALREEKCLSNELCRGGLAVVERTTQLPIVVRIEEQQ